jgi:hypothetical protein
MKPIGKFFLLLLTVSAILEALTGIALIVAPSLIVSLLIGTTPGRSHNYDAGKACRSSFNVTGYCLLVVAQ